MAVITSTSSIHEVRYLIKFMSTSVCSFAAVAQLTLRSEQKDENMFFPSVIFINRFAVVFPAVDKRESEVQKLKCLLFYSSGVYSG